MSALMIADLSLAEQLDSKAMKAVRGGFAGYPYFPGLSFKLDESKTVNAQQMIQQGLEIHNVSGNNNAFVTNVPTNITPTMHAENKVVVH